MSSPGAGGQFYRPRRSLSEAIAGAADVVGLTADRPAFAPPPQPEQPLPQPTGQPPYRLDLASVIGDDAVAAIEQRGTLTFHTVGDTGGVKAPQPQEIVTMWMEHDFDTVDPPPSFFYHLGDVVYFYGEDSSYYDQFYDPYLHYGGVIFAIPGNHDGAPKPNGGGDSSLAGFMTNFCSPTATVTADAQDAPRPAMTQPNCFWTLLAPLVTVVGLYTNVPEFGVVDQDQVDWFKGELAAAPQDRALVVALHHPPYSGDDHHSSSIPMRTLLEQSFADSHRTPNLVLAGHVHNYQRWTVPHEGGSDLTYVVAGAGGYHNLHSMGDVDGQPPPIPWTDAESGATLQSYNLAHRHGFLRLTVTRDAIAGVYTTVPRPQESWSDPQNVRQIDNFSIPLA